MGIAWSQFGPGIANTDYRASVEKMVWQPLVLHPGTMDETVLICVSEPALTSQFRIHFFEMIEFSLCH